MIRTKHFLPLFLFLLICPVAFAQQPVSLILKNPISLNVADSTPVPSIETQEVLEDTVRITIDSIAPIQKSNPNTYPPPFKDYRRLGYNTSIYAGATIIAFGVLWVMPEIKLFRLRKWTNWPEMEFISGMLLLHLRSVQSPAPVLQRGCIRVPMVCTISIHPLTQTC